MPGTSSSRSRNLPSMSLSQASPSWGWGLRRCYRGEGAGRKRSQGLQSVVCPVPWGACPWGACPWGLFPFGDCFPGSLEPEEDGTFLSLPRRKAFFFLHINVKLHNPIGNLDRLQLVAWVLILGTVGIGREMGGGKGCVPLNQIRKEELDIRLFCSL